MRTPLEALRVALNRRLLRRLKAEREDAVRAVWNLTGRARDMRDRVDALDRLIEKARANTEDAQ